MRDKGDIVAITVCCGIGAASIAAVLAVVYGIVIVAKWAWGS